MLQAEDPAPSGGPDGQECDGDRLRIERREQRLIAFDAAVEQVAARVLPAYRQANGWQARTRTGLLVLLRTLDECPEAARTLVGNSIAWGPEVLERRGELLEVLAHALEEGRDVAMRPRDGEGREHEQTSPPGELPETTGENLVGASLSWVHKRLLEKSGPLVELAPSLMSMIVHPYLGSEAAQLELERPLTDLGVEVAGRERREPIPGLRATRS
jgi:hypothetical protein